MSTRKVVCFTLFRVLLPLCLLAATVVRFNAISLVYGILLLTEPLLPPPKATTMEGVTGYYLIGVVTWSSLALLAQVIFQSILLAKASDDHPYGTMLVNCSSKESLLRQFGLQRLEANDMVNIIRVVIPDIGMFIVSLLILIICKKFIPQDAPLLSGGHQSTLRRRVVQGTYTLVYFVGEFLVVLFMGLSGIAYPSIVSSVYFLMFLAVATWWACYKALGSKFAVLRVILIVYSGSHLLILYLYQFQFFQESLSPKNFYAELFGLTGIIITDCRKPWVILFSPDAEWPVYVSPACILILYLLLACNTRRWCREIKEMESSQSGVKDGGRRRRLRRKASTGSERQVLGAHTDESLVDDGEDVPTYSAIGERQDSATSQHTATTQVTVGRLDSIIEEDSKERSPMVSLFVYIMKQSYAGTLIIMMAWSITYHSWLTFTLLILACILWILPNKRNVCHSASPFIVFYAESLLVISYVYGLNVKLPTETSTGFSYKEIGLGRFNEYPCLQLGVQIMFTFIFWLTLRQFMRERHWKKQEQLMADGLALESVNQSEPQNRESTVSGTSVTSEARAAKAQLHSADVVDGYDSENVKAVGRWIWSIFSKYWIVVCAVLFLIMAIQEAVIYRVIYMVLFLYFVLSFKLSYTWWRFSIYVFWWVTIIYSMFVLGLIYTYQFDNFPGYWKNGTGLSYEMLADIGLEQFNTTTLFVKLLTPTSFLVVIILQLHYFQEQFLKVSDINRYRYIDSADAGAVDDEAASDGTSQIGADGKRKKKWRDRMVIWARDAWIAVGNFVDSFADLAWRSLEVHYLKVVAFTIFICCLVEVSAINVVFVLVLSIGIPIPQIHRLMSHIALVWCGVAILAKMLFQLDTIRTDYWFSNCTNNATEYPFDSRIDNADFLGLEKNTHLLGYLKNYVAILVILAFEGIIWVRQTQHYNNPEIEKPRTGIIFINIKRADADKGLLPCIKFFANYCFYKFGLEICFIMTVVTMVVRLDGFSVIYGIFLGILLVMPRRTCYIVWPVYMIILSVFLFIQYLSCLGAPPGLCWVYPWVSPLNLTPNLQVFLYLPNYLDPPDPYKLVADFFQLLFVCLQWRVFYIENTALVESYGGGDNKEILDDVEANSENPVEDFITCKDSYLDYLKTFIFMHMFWVTLIIVFITGTARISLFCMGYLVGVFFFLWFGQELLIQPLRKLLKLWGILIGYTFFVLISKCALQLVGCVYLKQVSSSLCWLVQLLSIVCLKGADYDITDGAMESCSMTEDQSGPLWDSICFVFLILQLRIYKSHYFRHCVTELNVQNKLAARGAQLINQNLIESVQEQKDKEAAVLNGVIAKMEKLKMRQDRLHQKTTLFNSDDHYVVIRSGDYYLFDDDSEDETESSLEAVDTLALAEAEPTEADDKLGPMEIINTAMTSGTKEALDKVRRRSSIRMDSRDSTCEDEDGQRRPIGRTVSMSSSAGSARRSHSRTSDPGVSSVPVSPTDPTVPSTSEGDILLTPLEGTTSSDDHTDGEKEIIEEHGEEEQKPDTLWNKFVRGLLLVWAVIGGLLDYLIAILRDISKEYREVSETLDKEKEIEKEKMKRQVGNIARTEDETAENAEPQADDSNIDSAVAVPKPPAVDEPTDADHINEKDPEEEFRESTPRIFQLCIALFDCLISRSEMLCYFAMILNHMVSASLLSMVYPISVFLWALLSVPRPSKAYWVTVITYTEAIVVVKYLFQFGFFPWNDDGPHDNEPFWPPRIIGIEKKDSYAAFDLFLLVCLFIHRSVLKRNGLWKDAADAEVDLDQAEIASRRTTPAHSPGGSGPAITQSGEENTAAATAEGKNNEMFDFSSVEHSGEKSLETSGERQLTLSGEQGISGEYEDRDEQKQKKRKVMEDGLCESCWRPFSKFYKQMTNPDFNAAADVYALMFLCDFILFFIIVFGYKSFGPGSPTGTSTTVVTAVIQENKVPVPFLVMLLLQFVLIIIDRALYLRKMVIGKFIYQIFLVALIHIWMFIILPSMTHLSFMDNTAAQLWYFVKCIYFGLSAYQIRSGYPTRILGNFLTKKYNYTNLFLFKGFLAIPFLLELRALMDWMWTDTTLALTSWLEMEDIYANIFQLKCWRRAEDQYPTLRGQKRKLAVKYGVGGLILFLLIFIIWFPLLLFSLADTVLYENNPPIDCTMEVKLGGYQPIFQMSAQQQFLVPMSSNNYSRLQAMYKQSPEAQQFFTSYKTEDVMMVYLTGESTAVWGISPPSRQSLINDLNDTRASINLFVSISFKREPKQGLTSDTVSQQFTIELDPGIPNYMDLRRDLANMISGEGSSVLMRNAFPRYIRVPASESIAAVGELETGIKGSETNTTFHVESSGNDQWWLLKERTWTDIFDPHSPIVSKDYLTIIAFSDRVAPAGLSFFTGYGIIGLYVSLVLVVGRFVRIFFSGLSMQIMFQELPNVNKVLKLCLDVYLVREVRELRLEEELFAKLIFLYRSPETLIKWTKHKDL